MENIDATILSTLIRLIKYISIIATGYYAWYGAAHETRTKDGKLTGAGRIVARGVIASLIFGLMSQYIEDRRQYLVDKEQAARNDSLRQSELEKWQVNEKSRSMQMSKLESILFRSGQTLRQLQHQDSLAQKVSIATRVTLSELRRQANTQKQLINQSIYTVEKLDLQSKSTVRMLGKLSSQDSLQRDLITQMQLANKEINESSRKQNNLIDKQNELLHHAQSNIYPLNEITFWISLNQRLNIKKPSAAASGVLYPVKNSHDLSPKQLPDNFNSFSKKLKKIFIQNRLIDKSSFWAIKFYRRRKDMTYEEKAGLVYIVSGMDQYTQSIQLRYEYVPPVIVYNNRIQNPRRISFQQNVPFGSTLKRIADGIREYEHLNFGYDTGLMRRLISDVGPPTILNALDLIGAKMVIETVVHDLETDVSELSIFFGKNHRVELIHNQYSLSYDLMFPDSLNSRDLRQTSQLSVSELRETFPYINKHYLLNYTDTLSQEDLGLFSSDLLH